MTADLPNVEIDADTAAQDGTPAIHGVVCGACERTEQGRSADAVTRFLAEHQECRDQVSVFSVEVPSVMVRYSQDAAIDVCVRQAGAEGFRRAGVPTVARGDGASTATVSVEVVPDEWRLWNPAYQEYGIPQYDAGNPPPLPPGGEPA